MPKFPLPPLKEIIALRTEQDALEYLFDRGLIINRENSICGKRNIRTASNRQIILLEPCKGRLAYPTMLNNKYYWRCTAHSCRCRYSIFEGTLLDNFREPIADVVMAVYLSMSYVEQHTICCMIRMGRKTVQKIQEIIRKVKAIHRGTWDEPMLKVGGFYESDQKLGEDESSDEEEMAESDLDAEEDEHSDESVKRPSKKPKNNAPVISGKEYPHLLGKKVGGGDVPAVPGILRKYNFMEEAKAKQEEEEKLKKNRQRKSEKSHCSSACGGASSSSTTADSKSSSRSFTDEAVRDDTDDEPSVEEHRFFRGCAPSNLNDDSADEKISENRTIEHRQTVTDGVGGPQGLIWLDYEIPEYASTSAPDDAEGVDTNQYRMTQTQMDESLFGRQKYHKGHPVKGTWVLGVCEEGENADRRKLRLEVCPNRNTATLTAFIKKYVRPGTWLAHDYWRGYADGTQGTSDILGTLGIRGMGVNHDKTFKEWNPKHRKWVNTNTIEGNWNCIIAKVPKRHYRCVRCHDPFFTRGCHPP